MSIFKATPKNYATIVAPLTKIESDLSTYIGDQRNSISSLESEKYEIETKIGDANLEIRKSENTVSKIADLLSLDLDEDGIKDVDEFPPEEPEEPPIEEPEQPTE